MFFVENIYFRWYYRSIVLLETLFMEQKNLVDVEKIVTAVRLNLPISITTYTMPKVMSSYIDSVVSEFLKELHHPEMKDFLIYVINELALNAKKANTKRVYFMERKLDISDSKDYERGMKSFKADTLLNIHQYLKKQKAAGLYIKIILHYTGDIVLLEVRNNSELNKTEFKRIFDKIARSKQYTSLEEVLPKIFDESEGAGLGLVISTLMLQKIGVPNENFYVLVENGETIMRIVIPMTSISRENVHKYSKEIADYIEAIPRFPENIVRIQNLLNNPESEISDIAVAIGNDVSLTANLLKQVNSASFALPKKVMDIAEAVKLVGLSGIRNLLYSLGAMDILKNSSEAQEELWTHSYKTAFFAFNLARNKLNKRVITENVYVCGLLHDLGKIVLTLVYPDLSVHEKILKVKEMYHVPDNIFNMLVSTINHPEIGSALAEKWNFPEAIVCTIRYHHDYARAPEKYRELVATVCFADLMIHYLEESVEYYQIAPQLLQLFRIDSEENFRGMCKSFESLFAEE